MRRIAKVIARCAPNRRCRNAACPNCNRARQGRFTDQAQRAVASIRGKAGRLAVLSIIAGPRLAHGSTIAHIDEQLTRFTTRLSRGISDSGITRLIGGIDISANTDVPSSRATTKAKGVDAVRYQLHLWAIGDEQEIRRAMPSLRKAFPNSRSTPRAVRHVKFDGSSKGYAYALKPNFHQRIGILEMDDVEDGKVRRNTRLKPLTVPMHAEIAVILDRLGVHRRMFVAGFELRENRNSVATIVAQKLTLPTCHGAERRRGIPGRQISRSRVILSSSNP